MKKSKETGHSFEYYFKRAVNPMLVLLLLSERAMYVYEMAPELERRTKGKYTISLLYPVIYHLVEQGYVREGEKKISNDNRVRQYYEITPEGLKYLQKICDIYASLSQAVDQIFCISGGEEV